MSFRTQWEVLVFAVKDLWISSAMKLEQTS